MRAYGFARATLVAACVASGALTAAPSAGAAVTIGSSLSTTEVSFAAGGTWTNMAQPVNPAGSPIDGVIVRWRARFGEALNATPRVLSSSGNELTAIRSGPTTTAPAGLQVMPLSPGLPISSRNLVGVAVDDPNPEIFAPKTGAAVGGVIGSFPDGSTEVSAFVPANNEVVINADVEPDADGDSFGDETQDQCPGSSGPENGCPFAAAGGDTAAPDTQITRHPKHRTKKKRATFEFISTEPGSTFECKLDGHYQPCSSPFDVKVKNGKHIFEVRATDQAGNVDPTPAAQDWKLKKKKR